MGSDDGSEGRAAAGLDDGRAAIAAAARAVVLLDLDGTLAPIVEHPRRARVEPAAIDAIRALLAAGVGVAIVTGRPSSEARALLGVEDVEIAGLYGLEGTAEMAPRTLATIRDAAAAVPGAWVEPKAATAAVHVRASPPEMRAPLGRELERIARGSGLEVHPGKLVFDLVPAGLARKGAAVERLAGGADAVVYAGDDLPDLEAFGALDRLAVRGVAVVRVAVAAADSPSELLGAADVVLPDPRALASWLAAIAVARQAGGRT